MISMPAWLVADNARRWKFQREQRLADTRRSMMHFVWNEGGPVRIVSEAGQ